MPPRGSFSSHSPSKRWSFVATSLGPRGSKRLAGAFRLSTPRWRGQGIQGILDTAISAADAKDYPTTRRSSTRSRALTSDSLGTITSTRSWSASSTLEESQLTSVAGETPKSQSKRGGQSPGRKKTTAALVQRGARLERACEDYQRKTAHYELEKQWTKFETKELETKAKELAEQRDVDRNRWSKATKRHKEAMKELHAMIAQQGQNELDRRDQAQSRKEILSSKDAELEDAVKELLAVSQSAAEAAQEEMRLAEQDAMARRNIQQDCSLASRPSTGKEEEQEATAKSRFSNAVRRVSAQPPLRWQDNEDVAVLHGDTVCRASTRMSFKRTIQAAVERAAEAERLARAAEAEARTRAAGVAADKLVSEVQKLCGSEDKHQCSYWDEIRTTDEQCQSSRNKGARYKFEANILQGKVNAQAQSATDLRLQVDISRGNLNAFRGAANKEAAYLEHTQRSISALRDDLAKGRDQDMALRKEIAEEEEKAAHVGWGIQQQILETKIEAERLNGLVRETQQETSEHLVEIELLKEWDSRTMSAHCAQYKKSEETLRKLTGEHTWKDRTLRNVQEAARQAYEEARAAEEGSTDSSSNASSRSASPQPLPRSSSVPTIRGRGSAVSAGSARIVAKHGTIYR